MVKGNLEIHVRLGRRNFFFALAIEGAVVGVLYLFAQFNLISPYGLFFYLLPIFYLGVKIGSILQESNPVISSLLFLIFFVLNSLKWVGIARLFKKGHKKIAVIAVAVMLLVLCYFQRSYSFFDF